MISVIDHLPNAQRLRQVFERPKAAEPAADDAPLTVTRARQLLTDPRGVPVERANTAARLIRDFQLRKPAVLCRCGAGVWLEHEAEDGDSVWACAQCHMPPMTDDNWSAHQASQAARAAQKAAAEAAEAAATPTSRAALASVLAQLNEAREAHARLEAASPTAWSQLAAAQEAMDRAELVLTQRREMAAAGRVSMLLGDPSKTPRSSSLSAEVEAVESAREALETAKAASATIEAMKKQARDQERLASGRAKNAALAVLRDEIGTALVERAMTARREFVATSKALQWLTQHGASPALVAASEIMWSWSRAPETWRADGLPAVDLDGALERLLADPEADV